MSWWVPARVPRDVVARALLVSGLALTVVGAASASRVPSAELRFAIAVSPDSILVGDPITARVEIETPDGATLLLPQFADSVGPFTVLSAEPIERRTKGGRAVLIQSVQLTLWEPGRATLPALPLLWARGPEDTLVAYSTPVEVRVGSVLAPELAKQSKGGAAPPVDLSLLRGLKGVVSLGGIPWWVWLLIAAALGAGGYALWQWLRARRAVPIEAPAPPKVAPEVAFERGLDALLAGGSLERGMLKEFYLDLSQLLRRYLEERFTWSAVEATRLEVLEWAARRGFTAEDQKWLGTWLQAGDLVKFARGERLLAEAKDDAEAARGWVRRISRSPLVAAEAPVATTGGAAPPSSAPPAPPRSAEVPR